MVRNRYIVLVLLSLLLVPSRAAQWKTYFAYNNVTQIAMTPDKVYAISDGSLYSVHKQTEQIETYGRQSGLHATGITCIYYDERSKQLIIGYETGKIDLLTSNGVRYLGELYDKDMTQRKTINNITVSGYTAYLSTAFGVQTLDLRTNRLVDSYWLRPGGLETDVQDVTVTKDSIYAFTTDSLFAASLRTNIVDYTYWKRELRSGRVSPDPDKGVHYADEASQWYAAHSDGIRRVTPSGEINYKPQGPLSNIAYSITARSGHVWVVQGGAWAAQFNRPGVVMHYNGSSWRNVTNAEITAKLPSNQPARDFMNIAVDPADIQHYFATSYGTGFYEFRADTLFAYYTADGKSGIQSASKNPREYTRTNGVTYDGNGNVWVICAGPVNQLACLDNARNWHSLKVLINGEQRAFGTPMGMISDHQNAHYKWFLNARGGAFLSVLDDHGEPFNESVHQAIERHSWIDQQGHEFAPDKIYTIYQTHDGRVWMGSEQGAACVTPSEFFISDACYRPVLMDENGENPLTTMGVKAFCQTRTGEIWVGTETHGVYVLNADATQIIAHYTTDNSALPGLSILSLAYDESNEIMYIGTSEGLASYDPNGSPEGLQAVDTKTETEEASSEHNGTMRNWTLHYSYSEPQELAATPNAVYAAANGSLFSVDRKDESISHWDKSTGLNGSSVAHIAYDAATRQLVIAYSDGRMDLLRDDGEVTQMPELNLKAGSIATTVNCISVGSKQVYVGTPFAIIALNTRKGEITDTYYIGDQAESVDIQHIEEIGDSLFAISYNVLFKAALKDNLVDYTFWHREEMPFESAAQAAVWHSTLYVLQHDSLYRRTGSQWTLATPQAVQWIHAEDGQLLAYSEGLGTFRMTDEGLSRITPYYWPNDGLFSRGEYWLAQSKVGLIRLGADGDSYFNAGGPNSNFGYFMTHAHNQVYTTIGGRWAAPYVRFGHINIYTGDSWICIDPSDIGSAIGKTAVDISSIAVDPLDAGHFFAASFGRGVFEFRDYKAVKCYTADNSSLRESSQGSDPELYTLTDGATMDDQGNLWVLNATSVGQPVHVMSPNGVWHPLNVRYGGQNLQFSVPFGIWPDKRNSRYKWMIDQRTTPGLILLDDGETPTYSGDDYCVKRETFVDQNAHVLSPANFRCFAQDQTNRIWIGTESGLFTIPASVDFFKSNACQRIIIPRNDGTGLGDYLLGEEQINCLALDGGNRMWIGTANSGLYLIEDDTITVAHFTEDNSLLPSNTILSITIVPTTGDVFVGTDRGIASYRSDATEPQKNMSGAYAYPNPVRPDYTGYITITGLMDNTVVNIVDAGGNLVCKTRSHGGTAVWDGRLPDGRLATAGVYTALCNTEGGHAAVKILIIR